MENATGDCPIKRKIDQISHLLEEIVPNRSLSDKENGVGSCSLVAIEPHNYAAICERVSSFVPGHWGVREVTPLECARFGWKLIEPDVLKCTTCKQVICATLPLPTEKYVYSEFLGKFKEQIVSGHHEACWWRHNPCPLHTVQPLHITTWKGLHTLLNNAVILEDLGSGLPHLDDLALMSQLGIDNDLLRELCSKADITSTQKTTLLLILCGWSKGDGEYLRCRVCCRSVGLWSFVTKADETDLSLRSFESQEPVSKKCKTSEAEDPDEENGICETQEKCVESEDTQTQWRRERSLSEPSCNDELHLTQGSDNEHLKKSNTCCIQESSESVTTDVPVDHKQKIQKEYFHPLEEHRPWCPWIQKDEEAEVKGFQRIVTSIKDIINQSEEDSINFRNKIDENVRGIRLLRTVLDNSESVDSQ